MGKIAELGHVGLHVHDLALQRDFYSRVMGLTVTDEDEGYQLVFLSSRPEHEHHELVLTAGRNVPEGSKVLHQMSWRLHDVEALQEYHERFLAEGVRIEQVITHGNAIAIYFFDPEGNRLEVYVQTGANVAQPFKQDIDVNLSVSELLAESQRLVAERDAAAAESAS